MILDNTFLKCNEIPFFISPGTLCMAPLLQYLLGTVNWRNALRIIAAMQLVVGLPLTWTFDRPLSRPGYSKVKTSLEAEVEKGTDSKGEEDKTKSELLLDTAASEGVDMKGNGDNNNYQGGMCFHPEVFHDKQELNPRLGSDNDCRQIAATPGSGKSVVSNGVLPSKELKGVVYTRVAESDVYPKNLDHPEDPGDTDLQKESDRKQNTDEDASGTSGEGAGSSSAVASERTRSSLASACRPHLPGPVAVLCRHFRVRDLRLFLLRAFGKRDGKQNHH